MKLRAAAKFASKLVEYWLEIIFAEENPCQLQGIQLAAKFLRMNEWGAEDFEWARCAASFGNVCRFQQTRSGINRCRVESRHVR